jgi:hypothetical protein
MDKMMSLFQRSTPDRRGYMTWLFWAFALVGAYFLVTEHREHLFDYLPYLLLLACPLMHLFGHGGHSHRHHGDADKHDS